MLVTWSVVRMRRDSRSDIFGKQTRNVSKSSFSEVGGQVSSGSSKRKWRNVLVHAVSSGWVCASGVRVPSIQSPVTCVLRLHWVTRLADSLSFTRIRRKSNGTLHAFSFRAKTLLTANTTLRKSVPDVNGKMHNHISVGQAVIDVYVKSVIIIPRPKKSAAKKKDSMSV